MGKFSWTSLLSWNMTTTLKLLVNKVGQVNSRRKIMYRGMAIPWQMSPSPIWMFWISVASLEYPSAQPHVSTRTSWMSMERMGAFARSTTTIPVKGWVMQHLSESRLPQMRKSGLTIFNISKTLRSDGKVHWIRHVCLCSLTVLHNEIHFYRSLLKKDCFISTTNVYCTSRTHHRTSHTASCWAYVATPKAGGDWWVGCLWSIILCRLCVHSCVLYVGRWVGVWFAKDYAEHHSLVQQSKPTVM